MKKNATEYAQKAMYLSLASAGFSLVTLLMVLGVVTNLEVVQDRLEQTAIEAQEESQEAAAQLNQELSELSAQLDAAIPQEQFLEVVASMRRSVQANLANASEETREALMELDAELEAIEQEARTDTVAALESLQDLIERQQGDIAVDEEDSLTETESE